ncbi:hypothetical protein H2248_006493 [Termitomyces sp. 'cryptogamus']|nr:hypothetical protein H2248_006493 [Termitomyces sp. 'cryptogamus']
MQFKSLLVLASLAVSSFAQTSVAQVENDIENAIAPELSTLVADIDTFPTSGENLVQALTIHTDATNLIIAFAATTNDAATDIVARKAALAALPLEGVLPVIQQDLAGLKSNIDALMAAFIACVPADIVPAAQELQSEFDGVTASAIAAFT